MFKELSKKYPSSAKVFNSLMEQAPYLHPLVTSMLEIYGDRLLAQNEQRIQEIIDLSDKPDPINNAICAFLEFSKEFLTRQQTFLKTGEYACTDFEAVHKEVYANSEYYRDIYVPALLMCFILSPNYYEFFNFFEQRFLPNLPSTGLIAEFGCGHGLYLGQSLKGKPARTGIGFDIAEEALKAATKLFNSYDIPQKNYSLDYADFREPLPLLSGTLDAAICCEVLEHLPQPQDLLKEIRRVLKPSGTALLSAAIRMESVDHLHLFESTQEVIELINSAGLTISEQRVVPLTKPTEFDTIEKRTALVGSPTMPLGFICIANPTPKR